MSKLKLGTAIAVVAVLCCAGAAYAAGYGPFTKVGAPVPSAVGNPSTASAKQQLCPKNGQKMKLRIRHLLVDSGVRRRGQRTDQQVRGSARLRAGDHPL